VGVKMSTILDFRSTLPPQTAAKWERVSKPGVNMARDDFRTRQQQLYKNPFSGGGVACRHIYFTFSSNSTFSGFLVVSSEGLKFARRVLDLQHCPGNARNF